MTERILIFLNLLAVAVLVGKIIFLSFVTAPILSRTLDADSFAKVVRSLFPNTPLLQKQRDGLHRLSVQLNSVVLFMGLCLIGLSGISP